MSGQITISAPLLQSLGALTERPVDKATTRRASLHVLDWMGSAVLGAASPTGRRFAPDHTLPGPCQSLDGIRREAWSALQLNAACGNLIEMDDLHRASILHPGPVIIPAALAVAEQLGASGAQLLAAIVRGYEATIRIGAALGPSHYQYFHNTSTCGSFGAAVAACDLIGVTGEARVWALANAGSRTGGLWQMRHEPCETKSLHNVQAAQTGVQAAWLAHAGVRGPASLLEGPQGLFAATAPGADAARVLDAAPDWRLFEVSFKPWPACRHAHPTIDAALALRERIGTRTVQAVEVETYRAAIDFCDKPAPRTELEARFSLQHCVAVVIAHGKPALAHFAPSALGDAALAALRAKVQVHEAPPLTLKFPAHYGANIRFMLDDGSVLSHQQPDALGDPELPLDDSALIAKTRSLLVAAGHDNPDELASAALALAEGGSVTDFTAMWPARMQTPLRALA